LRQLARHTDLTEPEKTERYILNLKCKSKYKNNLLGLYQHSCNANKIQWKRPAKLKEEDFPIKVATEERINMIISSATQKYAMAFNISKYGLRPDEISKITLRDLDLDKGEIAVRTSKLGKETKTKSQN